MKEDPAEESRGLQQISLLKAVGVAAGLGVLMWLAAPFLIPAKVPEDFPALPDLQTARAPLQEMLRHADREARERPGSAERVGKLGTAYHANQYFEQAAQAYRIASRLAPRDAQWTYCRAFLEEENGGGEEQIRLLRETVRLQRDHVPALIKLADWSFKADRLDEASEWYAAAGKARDGAATLQATFGLARIAARRKQWNQVVERAAPLLANYSYAAPVHELLLEAYEALGQPDKAALAKQSIALSKWKVLPPPDDPLNEQLIAASYSSTRLLKQAGLQSRLGNPDRALEIGRRAAQAAPDDADARNFLARTLLTFYGEKPQAVDEALGHMSEYMRLRPGDATPLWAFADEFFKTPKPPPAVERLRALMQPHTNLPDAHYFLGLAADAVGNTGEAAAQYQAALKANPANSAVYNKLGLLADGAGRFDEAVTHLRKAVELNPVNTSARFNLGIALMQRGSYDQGLKEFEELLRTNPYDPATHFSMGFAYLYSKRSDEAIAKFREGLRYRPSDADGHFGLASAYFTQRRRDEAIAELRETLRLRPGYPPAQEMLAEIQR